MIKAKERQKAGLHEMSLLRSKGIQTPNDAGGAFSPFCELVGAGREGVDAAPLAQEGTHSNPSVGFGRGDLECERDVEAARLEAEALREEARTILENARKMAADIETEAYNQGYAQGQKDGEALGRKQYETRCARLKDVVSAIQSQAVAVIDKYEPQLVRLCMEISKAVIHREIETRPETIALCLKEAFKQVVEGSPLNIRLNPRDVEIASDFIEREARIAGGHPVNLTPDSRIDPGGCIIETDFGLIDATVDGKWQVVADAIKKILDGRRTGDGHAD
ncbi:MAG: FliH/SctL family protein [Dissulfurimicrobium sp.]|uniref:FliH/SctL family protein n=1 Tax=Dissulfurimicrobium TaxID=1769732 RepID=UPI001EDC32D8|nr:FliH/SctL family protein [Dissulfurimicrobium hydrothermale]UKL14659.1 hypothetical protein LGS26_00270 [Dissulfurimicrobium hydrothermale]